MTASVEENRDIEVLKQVYRAFGTGDMPTVLSAMDPQISWIESAGSPYAGTYSGPAAVLDNVFGRFAADWDNFAVTPDGFAPTDDGGVALGTYTGTNRVTGKDLRARFAHVWQLREGRLVSFEQIMDTAQLRNAMN